MPTYGLKVKGRGEEVTYSVDFPYDAYDCQVTMMERVVEALHAGENALLESPTGEYSRHPATPRRWRDAATTRVPDPALERVRSTL